MQDEPEQIGRRSLLKLGAGLAAGGANVLWPGLNSGWAQAAASIPLTDRAKPAHPVVLCSSQLEVVLDPNDGLPWEYKLIAANARMRGEDFGRKITATICQRKP
jgi:hypothetical protein